MNADLIRSTLADLDADLVAWLACDCLEHVAKYLKSNGLQVSSNVFAYLSYTRAWLYDPTCPSLTGKAISFDDIVEIKTMAIGAGKIQLSKLEIGVSYLMTPGQEVAAITSVATMLTWSWFSNQVAFLNAVWKMCGARSTMLLYENKCPINIEKALLPNENIYLIEPGDIQEVNWINVLILLAIMWIGIAILKLIAAFI